MSYKISSQQSEKNCAEHHPPGNTKKRQSQMFKTKTIVLTHYKLSSAKIRIGRLIDF